MRKKNKGIKEVKPGRDKRGHILMSGRKRAARRGIKKGKTGLKKKTAGIIRKRVTSPSIKAGTATKAATQPETALLIPDAIFQERLSVTAGPAGRAAWIYAGLFIAAFLAVFFFLPGDRADTGFFISAAAAAAAAAVMAVAIIHAAMKREKTGFHVYLAFLLPVIISIFMAIHFRENASEGGVHVGLLPVPLAFKQLPGYGGGNKSHFANTSGLTGKLLSRFAEISSGPGIESKKKEYFRDHVHILFRNTGTLAGEGKTAPECLSAWQSRGFPAIKEQPQANAVAIQLIKDNDGIRISWAGNSPGLRLRRGNKLSVFYRQGNADETKKEAFARAADMLITDKNVRKQVEEYYENPSVRLDTAGEVAPFYVYYLACLFVFDYETGGQGSYSSYVPAAPAGSPPDFLKMDEMFDTFMDKAYALDGLASLVGGYAGRRTGQEEINRARQEAGKIAGGISAEDAESAAHFITLALKASLVAQQWAIMQNSIHKSPWFETTYSHILNRALLGMFLEKGVKPGKYPEQYKKFVAAASLMLYKTSRVMGTYKDSPKLMEYSDDYMIAHAVLMHFMDGFDAALRESVARELDRYYAGRYYGKVDY